MPERRNKDRIDCYLRGEVLLENGHRRLTCEAHDISDRGMRITCSDLSALPDSFILTIPRRDFTGRVDVVRRGEHELGVVIRPT
jgi:PilZ domain